MKVIETQYKGYRFRSRLEARWAVFFDALGLKWEYEPEGYELPNGWYLPDFFLYFRRHPMMIIEIKGKAPSQVDLNLLNDVSIYKDRMAMLVHGDPLNHNGYISSAYSDFRVSDGNQAWFFGLMAEFEDNRPTLAAARSARAARFEHGQHGAPVDLIVNR